MSLDRTKLNKLRQLGRGGWQGQCPACAETGQDRTGEHLRISSDGKFGCCVFPGDRKHRSRIFALAGDSRPKTIKVRVASAKTLPSVQLDLLGRLGRVFESPEGGKGETEEATGTSGTLGTGTYLLRIEEKDQYIYIKDNRGPVPSVPTVQLPYLTESGDLVIPFNSPERYHWWKGEGQSIRRTFSELRERKENEDAPF